MDHSSGHSYIKHVIACSSPSYISDSSSCSRSSRSRVPRQWGKDRLLLMLKTQSSRIARSLGRLLLLLKTQRSRTTQSLGRLLLLLKTQRSRTSWGKRTPSPPRQDLELQDTTGKRPPSTPAKDTHSHPSIEQAKLLPSTDT
jgi:hypothetical protein